MKRNWMPIQNTSLAVSMHRLSQEQAVKNHDQTLDRLAERGGLSLSEAAALTEERRWEPMEKEDALAVFTELH